MPALHSAAISTKMMKVFGGAKLIGPLLIGLGLPIEVAPLRSSTSDILNLASVAAYSAHHELNIKVCSYSARLLNKSRE